MGIGFSELALVVIGTVCVLGVALALAWIEATPRRRPAENPTAGGSAD